jgi:ADP-heptose:LPS heptosyltransferase
MLVEAEEATWRSVSKPVSAVSSHANMSKQRLGVIYTSGGIGDHLLALPALRAILHSFPRAVKLVCIPGSREVLFRGLPFLEILEVSTLDYRGGQIGMSQKPVRSQFRRQAAYSTCDLIEKPTTTPNQSWWSFDVSAVVNLFLDCDILVSLALWHSTNADDVLAMVRPSLSVGFSQTFDRWIRPNFDLHVADLYFSAATALDPTLRIHDFIGPTAVHAQCRRRANLVRASIPQGYRVIAVHADTMKQKMWPPRRFAAVLDLFLERHPEFVVLVVGTQHLPLSVGRYRERFRSCVGLPLSVSLALVETVDVFLGVDSCMLHCADLQKIPSLGLFRQPRHTEPATFPWCSNAQTWGVRFAPHVHVCGTGTMASIREEEVNKALESLVLDN